MEDVKINSEKTLQITLPSDPDDQEVAVFVFHELGDQVYGPAEATRESPGVYSITLGQEASGVFVLNSGGKHRVDFEYEVSGQKYTKNIYLNVYTPYIEYEDFFSAHTELTATYGSNFDFYAKRAKSIIDTYCGQSFEYYPNKSVIVNGNNHNILHLPRPLFKMNYVKMISGNTETFLYNEEDGTAVVEKVRQPFNFSSSYYIRYKNSNTMDGPSRSSYSDFLPDGKFKENLSYEVNGDFGWLFVPENVSQAADLIIVDLMNDDSQFRRQALTSVNMDAISFTMKSTFYESTGNIEADVLLMDYILFVMDYIS
jgi:hypothetical protein